MLLPGICCHASVFANHRGKGLAWQLDEFFQVFPSDLRHPDSMSGGFDFDSHLHEDLPRLVSDVRRKTGSVPWLLGHSMGAQLALAASAMGLITVRGVIAVAPPCTLMDVRFYPPLMRIALGLGLLLGLKRVPVRLGARLLFLWFSRNRLPRDLLLFHSMARRSAFDVPLETLAQATLWVNYGIWCDRSGSRSYLEVLNDLEVPTLFIAGSKDRIASPESVQAGFERTGSVAKEFTVVPGATHIGLLSEPFSTNVAQATVEWVRRYSGNG